MHRNTDINGNNAWNVGGSTRLNCCPSRQCAVILICQGYPPRSIDSLNGPETSTVRHSFKRASLCVSWRRSQHVALQRAPITTDPADGYLYASGLHVYILYTLQYTLARLQSISYDRNVGSAGTRRPCALFEWKMNRSVADNSLQVFSSVKKYVFKNLPKQVVTWVVLFPLLL